MEFDPLQGRKGFGARLFTLRFHKLGLTQQQFADRFGLTLGCMKDVEQGRHQPHPALRLVVAAIELDPVLMTKAAGAAARD